jgi:hypothetical protein
MSWATISCSTRSMMTMPGGGGRLRLWTVTINGTIVHPTSDTWAWRTMVKLYRQEKTPDSSTRALEIIPAESSSSKVGRNGEINYDDASSFILRRVLLHSVKSHDMGPAALLPLRKKACWGILSSLKNPSPSAEFEYANLGSNGKHADHCTTEDKYYVCSMEFLG